MNVILKKVRQSFSILILAGAATTLFTCSGSTTNTTPDGEWVKQSDFDGSTRSGAVLFMIGNTPYLGTGYNTINNSSTGNFLNDFWVYNSGTVTWDTIPHFPGVPRSSGVAFSINGKGYVGLGYDGTKSLSDFWQYDPSAPDSSSWKRIADFPGDSRYGASAFTIDNLGYVGTGFCTTTSTYLKDFWAYNPTTNTWSQKGSINTKRYNSFSFVINGRAYLGGGLNNGQPDQTFYSYDPAIEDRWKEEFDLQDDTKDSDPNDKGYTIARQLATTLVIGEMAYVVGGNRSGSIVDQQCWQYNPKTLTWILETPFQGPGRDSAVGYVLGSIGYVATGRNGNNRWDDIWSFDPTLVHVN